MNKESIFTVGGTVQASNGLYIPRHADDELLALCRAGSFAYVLTPRQLGKSSLMVRTAEQLTLQGTRSVIIDLSQIGVQVTAEEWYLGLLSMIEEQLNLDTDAINWWQKGAHLGMTQRLTRFFEEVLLREISAPVVIFVDEIDTTLSLGFTDDFFAAIRYFYNARALSKDVRRLSFVLIGVATPGDLIRDPQRTPFNIGQRVDLTDFTLEEALPFAAGLGLTDQAARQVLGWVLKWTGGHPYLTQRLCRALTDDGRANWSEAEVDAVVGKTFFGKISEQDNNLQFVRDMLTKRAPDLSEVLYTYREVLNHTRPVQDEEQSLIKSHLKLSGVAQRRHGELSVRNPIYAQVFNDAWVKQHLPVNWTKRLTRVAIGLVLTLMVLSVPTSVWAIIAQRRAVAQRDEAKKARLVAEQQTEIAQRQTEIANLEREKAVRARLNTEDQRRLAVAAADKEKIARQSEAVQRQRAEEASARAEAARRYADAARRSAEVLRKDSVFGGKIAAMAEVTRTQQGRLLESSVILAREAMLRAPTSPYAEGLPLQDQKLAASNVGQFVLPYQTLSRSLALLPLPKAALSHKDVVPRVVFSPDGQYLATINGEFINRVARRVTRDLNSQIQEPEENDAIVWDARTGKMLAHLAHDHIVAEVVFSRDGRFVATGSYDRTARIWSVPDGREVRRFAHTSVVQNLAFSPDGTRLVTTCGETLTDAIRELGGEKVTGINIARVWDVNTGVEITSVTHKREISDVAFSPNGKYILTGSTDRSARVWDAKTGLEFDDIYANHGAGVTHVAISPTGKLWASVDVNGVVIVIDMTVKRERKLAIGGSVNTIVFSSDGRYLATAGSDGTARVWQLPLDADGRLTPSISAAQREDFKEVARLRHENKVNFVAFSPDGQMLATASDDGTARVWKISSGREVARMTHGDKVNVIAFSPSGEFVATGSDDKTARMWQVAGGPGFVHRTFDEAPQPLELSTDRNYLATVSSPDNVVRVWETSTGRVRELGNLDSGSKEIYLNRDGKYLAAVEQYSTGQTNDKKVKVFEAATGRKVAEVGGVNQFALSPDGKHLATGTYSEQTRANEITIWETNAAGQPAAQRQVTILKGEDNSGDNLRSVGFSPDAKYVLTSYSRGKPGAGPGVNTVRVWDWQEGKVVARINHGNSLNDFDFSPDSRYLVTVAQADKTARVWQLPGGGEVTQSASNQEVIAVKFGRSGQLIATADTNGLVRVFEIKSGSYLADLGHSRGRVNDVTFSNDGHLLATAGDDNTVRVWDVLSGRELARIRDEGPVRNASFSVDEKYLVIASATGVQAWLWRPTDLFAQSCVRLTTPDLTSGQWAQYLTADEHAEYIAGEKRQGFCSGLR